MSGGEGLDVVRCPHGNLFPVGYLDPEQLNREIDSNAFVGLYDTRGHLVFIMNETRAATTLLPARRKPGWIRHTCKEMRFERTAPNRFEGKLSGPKKARVVFMRLSHGLDKGQRPEAASVGACGKLLEEATALWPS